MSAPAKNIAVIRRGEIIRAAYLSDMARAINQLNGASKSDESTPLQNGEILAREKSTEQASEKIVDSRIQNMPSASHVWTEFSRYEEQVRVKNPDDENQYVDVGRIRIVQSVNLLGEHEYRVFEDGTG